MDLNDEAFKSLCGELMAAKNINKLVVKPGQLDPAYATRSTTIEVDIDNVAELKRLTDVQAALNKILSVSLQNISLVAMLQQVLELVLEIPWLALEKKGCIFLTKGKQKTLELVVHHNLGKPLLKMCENVPFGRCLCGRAAQSQKLVFKDCVDADHENLPAGITPHGHYNIPIVTDDVTMGVLNLYVKHGHQPEQIEQQFLSMVAVSLAGIIGHKQSETRLQILSRAVESSASMILITDSDGKIEYVNPRFTTVNGYTIEELIGKSPRIFQAIETSEDVYTEMRKDILSGKEWQGEFYNKKKNGDRYWSKSIVSPIRDENGQISHIVSIQEDITKEYELSQKLSHQASHDELTGLINRREFENCLEQVIYTKVQGQFEHSLIYMDLDQFKVVNDSCGHDAGDELLRQVGGVFRSVIRKSDTLARLGGDEFGLLMENCSVEPAQRVANALLKAVMDFQFNWDARVFRIGISIGLVVFDGENSSLTELMKRADAACYRAKNLGRNRVHLYEAEDQGLVQQHGEMRWVEKINLALDEGRFVLHAQPIVPVNNLSDEHHYELLIRMVDTEGKIIPPGAFIPAAERYDLMTKVDRWVVSAAFKLYKDCEQSWSSARQLSINISGQSIAELEFLDFVVQQIQGKQIPADHICFEITETAAISNMSTASHFIAILRTMGCKFSLDDFGSGLSSFGYLKNFHVDYLKIDGMFVKEIVDNPIDFAMVKSINDVAQVMGMETIAEFVENDAIIEKLRLIGVNYLQGYGVGKPKSVSEIWVD